MRRKKKRKEIPIVKFVRADRIVLKTTARADATAVNTSAIDNIDIVPIFKGIHLSGCPFQFLNTILVTYPKKKHIRQVITLYIIIHSIYI